MSQIKEVARTVIPPEEVLQLFPESGVGKTHEQICKSFRHYNTEEVNNALKRLVNRGELILKDGVYRVTDELAPEDRPKKRYAPPNTIMADKLKIAIQKQAEEVIMKSKGTTNKSKKFEGNNYQKFAYLAMEPGKIYHSKDLIELIKTTCEINPGTAATIPSKLRSYGLLIEKEDGYIRNESKMDKVLGMPDIRPGRKLAVDHAELRQSVLVRMHLNETYTAADLFESISDIYPNTGPDAFRHHLLKMVNDGVLWRDDSGGKMNFLYLLPASVAAKPKEPAPKKEETKEVKEILPEPTKVEKPAQTNGFVKVVTTYQVLGHELTKDQLIQLRNEIDQLI